MFDSGELALTLLYLTAAQPRHGYELIQEIQSLAGGAYTPSPGIVYPTLTMLEELGQLEAVEAEGTRRAFVLTEAGRGRLSEQALALDAVLSRLKTLQDGEQTDEANIETSPVWRAMQNLKIVLQQRLGNSADRQTLFDIADLVDEAARRIERL